MSSRFDVQHITSGFLLFFGSPNPKKCPMLTVSNCHYVKSSWILWHY